MIRTGFNVASSLSLLLGCVIAAAWACGRSTPRAFEFGYKGQLWQVVTDGGRLRMDNEPQRQVQARQLRWVTTRLDDLTRRVSQYYDQRSPVEQRYLDDVIQVRLLGRSMTDREWESLDPARAQLGVTWRGFFDAAVYGEQLAARLSASRASPVHRYVRIARLLPLAAILPLLRLSAWGFVLARRRSRRRAGLCGWCGYDLRGSPSGRCSECGAETKRVRLAER